MATRNDTSLTIIRKGLLKGISIGAGIGIGLISTALFAAAATMKMFSSGEVISATELNRNFTIAGPEGEVSAFYLPDCPEGWAVADGTSGTPDLRGRFIRGLDDVGAGPGNVDPDTATRTIGSIQLDAFQGHAHIEGGNPEFSNNIRYGLSSGLPLANTKGGFGSGTGGHHTSGPIADGINGPPRTGAETRPVNVALIYCMRMN